MLLKMLKFIFCFSNIPIRPTFPFLLLQILDRVSDGMAFGALLPCEECQGQVVFKTDAYYCTGDISAWTKCVAKTQTPSRKDWVTPKVSGQVRTLLLI